MTYKLIMSYTSRSLPYIEAMRRVKTLRGRKQLFSNLPKFVVDDMAIVLYNIILGNAKISPNYKNRLSRIRQQLYKIIRARGKNDRRRELYKQSGTGIFTILLPALASVISSFVAKHV